MTTTTTTDTDAAPAADKAPRATSSRTRTRTSSTRPRRSSSPTADTPPAPPAAGPTPPPGTPGRGPGRPSTLDRRAGAVTGLATTVGVIVSTRNAVDGAAIIDGANDLGVSLAKLAERNPRVARALDSMLETSAWAEVGGAVAAIVLPILVNHGVFERARRSGDVEHDAGPVDPTPADDPAPAFGGFRIAPDPAANGAHP